MKRRIIYFDNAATTPLAPEVKEEMIRVINEVYGNPSSIHYPGREAKVLIEEARKHIASQFNVNPSEIIFTSCATEAINLVILNAIENLEVSNIITSPIEHYAVLKTIDRIKNKCKIHFLSINEKGNISLEELEYKLSNNNGKTLVILMHANNEIGNLLSLKETGKICNEYDAYFLCDTVQTVGKYRINFKELGIHFGVCSAHKFHGPKGIGFLYADSLVGLLPQILGGGQERGLRSGTENIYGIAGMSKAIQVAYDKLENDQNYIKELKNYLINEIENNFENFRFNGNCREGGLYTIVNCSFSSKIDMLVERLDMYGIAVSGGSACSSGTLHQSHVLKAMNCLDEKIPIRFSFSKFNTKEEIDFCIEIMKKIIV